MNNSDQQLLSELFLLFPCTLEDEREVENFLNFYSNLENEKVKRNISQFLKKSKNEKIISRMKVTKRKLGREENEEDLNNLINNFKRKDENKVL
jgi:hypothetical protein